ncbi:MAG: Lrp/AsnC family transcriptional regulator [Candidatus Omnitrophica bacterium]|nr:Lrp/AsnC family transcriptional regulator [Candidatus Omnitrophota bacterium]
MDPILSMLEKNSRVSPAQIAKATRQPVGKVKSRIRDYEKKGVIVKYKAVINRDLVEENGETVQALIEVKVAPEKDRGFDHLAERIYRFPEVLSCYLLSGSYDLLLLVEGKTIQTIANFVASKLSPLENVRGTVTHFLLKKYKENGDILRTADEPKRMAISY